ncbi:MAG: lysophospholipid acyltransferase family protein [Bacteroidetes bacterium]|nr:lysophospholipid acyltransferase family protein [Bacteroidota bacterium]
MVIINYFLISLIWFFSLLPFKILYFFSDFLYLLIYYVFGYRKKEVKVNLVNSFPNKSAEELKKIEKKYYHNLCDLIVEIAKIRHISQKQLLSRIQFKNKEIVNGFIEQGKSVFVVTGHIGNWEWTGMSFPLNFNARVIAVVKPLTNKFFDNYFYFLRTRFTSEGPVPFKQTLRALIKHKNEKTITVLASDQTPAKEEIEYWTTFLNQDTPVFLGTEKMAKALDVVVLFFTNKRVKRGYYEIEFSTITNRPKETKEFEITESHVNLLEKFINNNPDNWLWSHRRWKHKKQI